MNIDPATHKQLFLDGHAVHSTTGVRRTLHPPEKHGPLIAADNSLGQVNVQSRSAPQWNSEKGIWEWWYFSSCPEVTGGKGTLTNYAISTDGLHWERPSLGRYEWKGSRDNNIAGDPDRRRLYHILRDERDEDPARRYKGLFDFRDRWIGFSPDGFDWTMPDISPVPSGDESHLVYDEWTGQFLAFVKQSSEWGRSVYLATSTDFESWTFPKLVFNTDEVDNQNRIKRIQQLADDPDYMTPRVIDELGYSIAQCYQMAVLPYEGLYVGFPVIYNPSGLAPPGNDTGVNQVELTVSRDLYNWDRVADRALFIGVDPWDGVKYGTAQNLLCGRPVVREDEIWVYYNALRLRDSPELIDQERYRLVEGDVASDMGALSLAKLRLDGFVSLGADAEGTITTAPFEIGGGALRVNVDAGAGELVAELLDAETMEPLPGLSVAECETVRGDHLSAQVSWRGNPSPPNDRPVRTRFLLRGAELYAFWLER